MDRDRGAVKCGDKAMGTSLQCDGLDRQRKVCHQGHLRLSEGNSRYEKYL